MKRLTCILFLLVPLGAFADEHAPRDRESARAAVTRHFLLTAQHTLRPDERAALEAAGVQIQQVLPDERYIVRTEDAEAVADDPRVRSIEALAPSSKIARSALREAARARPFARVRLVFHNDVSYGDARAAVERAGGSVDQVLASDYALPQRLSARVPFASIESLAADDRVYAIYGPSLKMAPLNAVAAQLSKVTPLFSAPYNLNGQGIVLSEFEFAEAFASHVEFGGRLTTHITGGDDPNKQHGTHVAGTMIASGVNAAAKGMAPAATLHEFNADPDCIQQPDIDCAFEAVLATKRDQLPPLGITGDNNSWGFSLGWQLDPSAPSQTVWEGGDEEFGAYDGYYNPPYDEIARTSPVLFVHAAGNDGDFGQAPFVNGPLFAHGHADANGNTIKNETFCYSANGQGNDCPAPCTNGPAHCEITKHRLYGPLTTVGPTGSLKNIVVVGAVNAGRILATFSSEGPTLDGRIKPDLVAKGVAQFSTFPNNAYSQLQGTSMSSPVVTGISALLAQQYRMTFGGQNPAPVVLKALMIDGADDLGSPGPDFLYGYGLIDAQASVDLIIADGNKGTRIQSGSLSQGQQLEIPLTVATAQNVRVVLTWFDAEVALPADDLAMKTLVNDLDMKVTDPGGNTVLPYVFDKSQPTQATKGVNSVDNTEEIEILNAPAGNYRILLTGTTIASGPSQSYALVANAALGVAAAPCTDPFEPNDSDSAAFGFLVSGATIRPSLCTATDIDEFKIRTTASGPLTVTVTATDTPMHVTLSGNGITPVVRDIAAGANGTVSTQAPAGTTSYLVKVELNGTRGATGAYTLVPTFSSAPVARHRSTRH